jgi:RNA polymerase sigma-70 factor (ECF subfamily)
MKPTPPTNSATTVGKSRGVDTLIPLVYDELRRLAGARFRSERPEHTLQPTAVVNEAYLRLKHTEKRWESKTEFIKYAAPVIRHVLVDYARSRPSNQRVLVTSWENVDAEDKRGLHDDVLALDEVLNRLEQFDCELAELVVMRYFGGLTVEETTEASGIPLGTLKDRLTFARTWLRREITKPPKR